MNAIYSSLKTFVRLCRNFWLSLFGFARIEADLITGKDVDQCHEGFVALGIASIDQTRVLLGRARAP